MERYLDCVEGYKGSLEKLAKAVGNTTYDLTSLFIEGFAEDLRRQADASQNEGRKNLASQLYATSDKIFRAKKRMDKAWDICEPYTTEWVIKNKHPRKIVGFEGSLETAAKAVGNLDYDQITVFIKKFAKDISRQGEGDFKAGKTGLATELFATANYLYAAKEEMDCVLEIYAMEN